MLEDARETIAGAIIYVKVAEDGSYELEADRYQYTAASGGVQPSEYMVDTMLMLQGLLRGGQLAPVGLVCSTNTSLVKKLQEGRDRRRWAKNQQGTLAECVWEKLHALQWEVTAVQVPGCTYEKVTDIDSKGVSIVNCIAAQGEEGVPGGRRCA